MANVLDHYIAGDPNPQEASAEIKFQATTGDLTSVPDAVFAFEPLLEAFDIEIKAKVFADIIKAARKRLTGYRGRNFLPLTLVGSANIDLEVEPFDLIPERYLRLVREKLGRKVPTGNITAKLPQEQIEATLDKLPLLESINNTFNKCVDASEFKMYASVYGKNLSVEIKAPGIGSLSPIKS